MTANGGNGGGSLENERDKCGRSVPASVSDNPEKPLRVENADKLHEVIAAHGLVLVDCYTNGCTLCQAIEPVVGNVARATDATVVMVNPGNDLSLVERYNIRSVPTLLLFEDGNLVGRMADGFRGTDAVVAFVEETAS
ncbi:thioredoxin family protein [Haladaptatus pallidirubidus]|uniref:Thioredoxin family protein n=1 Tax=Haladaptatus pallidirubidus TaxID=1008152 RepID=A0AAV3UMR2_9EURY|nr:thioredoxin family protein [Haladaptatus pallidirubidus]